MFFSIVFGFLEEKKTQALFLEPRRKKYFRNSVARMSVCVCVVTTWQMNFFAFFVTFFPFLFFTSSSSSSSTSLVEIEKLFLGARLINDGKSSPHHTHTHLPLMYDHHHYGIIIIIIMVVSRNVSENTTQRELNIIQRKLKKENEWIQAANKRKTVFKCQ